MTTNSEPKNRQTALVTGASAGIGVDLAECFGYRAWKESKRVEITGLRNRVMAAAVPFLPRAAILGIVRNLQSPL